MLFAKWMETGGMTQAEAARRLGVSESMVSLLISGTRKPSAPLAQHIVSLSNGKVSLEEALFPEQYGGAA
jgi:transcriptional regulator with XRE-family HTH domain